jgi:hypothetical protein
MGQSGRPFRSAKLKTANEYRITRKNNNVPSAPDTKRPVGVFSPKIAFAVGNNQIINPKIICEINPETNTIKIIGQALIINNQTIAMIGAVQFKIIIGVSMTTPRSIIALRSDLPMYAPGHQNRQSALSALNATGRWHLRLPQNAIHSHLERDCGPIVLK